MNRRKFLGGVAVGAIIPVLPKSWARQVPIPEKVIKVYRGYPVEDDAMFEKIRSWVPEHHHEAFCGDVEKCMHARYGIELNMAKHYGTIDASRASRRRKAKS